MKRVFLTLSVLAVLGLGVRWLVRSLASTETKVRWRIESMVHGFNSTRLAPIRRGLAPDFFDTTSEADLEIVENAVIYLFLNAKDPQTRGFLYRAELESDGLSVEVPEEAEDRARARFVVRFFESQGEQESLSWSVNIDAELKRDEEGWRFRKTSHETLEGQRMR